MLFITNFDCTAPKALVILKSALIEATVIWELPTIVTSPNFLIEAGSFLPRTFGSKATKLS
ncbi:hypothetical protein D3C87_1998360 [compost metagenome]